MFRPEVKVHQASQAMAMEWQQVSIRSSTNGAFDIISLHVILIIMTFGVTLRVATKREAQEALRLAPSSGRRSGRGAVAKGSQRFWLNSFLMFLFRNTMTHDDS